MFKNNLIQKMEILKLFNNFYKKEKNKSIHN